MRARSFMTAVVLMLVAGCAGTREQQPSEFTLNRYMHPAIGPIAFQHGQKLKIGEDEYVIQKAQPERRDMERLLESIVVPELDFRQADIRDAVQFLAEMARPGPPDINIVFTGNAERTPKLTLTLRSVSLYQALRTVCAIAQLELAFENGVVILKSR